MSGGICGVYTADVKTSSAFMKVLAEDVKARIDSPEFDKSLMDGFAVRSIDTVLFPVEIKCVDTIPAGVVARRRIGRFECVKISTGAMLPEGADSVVMKEEAFNSAPGKIGVSRRILKYENVARRSRDIRKGSILMRKGELLNSAKIGLLSSQGITKIRVYKAPVVSIVCTGNEVIEPGKKKGRAQAWNATATILSSLLGRWGIKAGYLGIARDNPIDIKKKIARGFKSDILIITGAVSVGDFDFVPFVLNSLGAKIKFHKVAIKPGKPVLFAKKGNCMIFGLPGNPVSGLVSYFLFIDPVIRQLLGLKEMRMEEGVLTRSVHSDDRRLGFFPGRLINNNKSISIVPLAYKGSSDLVAMADADVIFKLEGKKKLARGARVNFLRLY